MVTSAFNSNIDDNKYLGFMYNPSGTKASTSRVQATTNQTDSAIKTYLDTWYINNIVGTGYEAYLSDTLLCDDRQLRSEVGDTSTGTGFGQSVTYYAIHERYVKKNPSLKCGLKNDRFTVTDTAIGNGALTYPIGLLTIDEVSLAGLTSESYYTNNNNYLYVGRSYFTLSPAVYLTDITGVFYVHNHYVLASSVGDGKDVRGVINLKPNTPVTGTGSTLDPFIVQ